MKQIKVLNKDKTKGRKTHKEAETNSSWGKGLPRKASQDR